MWHGYITARAVGRRVHPFPETPALAVPSVDADGPPPSGGRAADRTTDLPDGHLWLQEYVVGAPFRFSVAESGLTTFGDAERSFDEVPLPYRFAARHVRERLALDALRTAADDPSAVTFFGVATRREAVDYDWDRLPPVLVTDIWSDAREACLPPDAVERACERLGLTPANPFEKEVPARHFTLATYDVPASEWYDGPAAGVLFRNKTGGRALLWNADLPFDRPDPLDGAAEDLAERFVTAERVERAARDAAERGQAAAFDATFERTLEEVARREYALLYRDGDLVVDPKAFRSAAAERVQRHLGQ